MPRSCKSRVARRTWSTVTRRSIASSTRCDPLSDPIHSRRQPRRTRASATLSSIRSAREMHSKGTRSPRRSISSAYWRTQPAWMVKTSSTYQSMSGR